MTSSVPRLSFTPSGIQVPADPDVLAGVLADMNAACGGGMNLNQLENPLGQLASTWSAQVGDKNAQLLALFTQIDPAFAVGRMQDAIARIYFIQRIKESSTTAPVTCGGADGTPIPIGAKLYGADGETYVALGTAIISGGVAQVSFACVTPGPISCPRDTLSTSGGAKIITSVAGWDTTSQPVAGTLGRYVESPRDFETRRRASVAKNGAGFVPSVRGAVLAVPGVLDAYVIDNPSGSPKTVGGVTLPPHSLYVCATGGTDLDVANAILTKKSPGCDMVGNTTVNVPDTAYLFPQPTYPVTFQRSVATPVYIALTMVNASGVPADVVTRVRNAMVNAFAGADGGPRARIGQALYATRFIGPVAALGPWAQVVSASLGLTPTTVNAASLTLPINQQPTLDPSNVFVTLV
jgi:hypothetical protein